MASADPRKLGALFLGTLLLGSCAKEPTRPSVLLITLDTTRADRIGCYGRADAGTIYIDGLAARGLFFERALTPVPVTLPAHASLMTGSPPVYHGVRDNGLYVVDDELVTLAERYAAAGYRTAGFVSAFPLEARFGLDQGFELFDDALGGPAGSGLMHERPADEPISRAKTWLDNLESDEPFFLWVHLFDPHMPHLPPKAFAEAYPQDLYQGEIAFVDSQLGRLFAALESSDRMDETLVAVTADHGESLGEFGELSHGHLLYDATQHVPMVLAGPGVPAVGGVPGAVGLIDLAPTLLELSGLAVEGFETHGARSLVPTFTDVDVAPAPILMEALYPRLHEGWSELLGLELDGWQYVVAPGARAPDGTPAAELFDVRLGQLTNLVTSEPARAAELAATLETLMARLAPREPFGSRPGIGSEGADITAGLDALGYTGLDLEARVPEPDAPGLDPRRVIRAAVVLSLLPTYLEQQQFALAEAELEVVRALDPEGILIAEGEGLLAMARAAAAPGGDEAQLARARAAFATATERAPGRRGLWTRLAEAEEALGEYEAALLHCRRALSLAPPTQKLEALRTRLVAGIEARLATAERRGDLEAAKALRSLLEAE